MSYSARLMAMALTLACLSPLGAVDQTDGAQATGAATPSSFTTTVTPPQPLGVDAGGGGSRDAALCWSGGENSWTRQGRRHAAGAAVDDPQLEERKTAFTALVARWRAAVIQKQYAAAEAAFTEALALLDGLAARRIEVAPQLAFTRREQAQCLSVDALTRLAGDWPGAGETASALARAALIALPGDAGALQAADAAATAIGEQRGRQSQQQAAEIGVRIDQLTAQALADRAEAARLGAAGDAAGERERAQHARACLDDCRHVLELVQPLETTAHTAFQDACAAAQALLVRARAAEHDGHALTAFGVAECTTLAGAETALLAAAAAALARDELLRGRADLALTLAHEALSLEPASASFQALCRRLEALGGSARSSP